MLLDPSQGPAILDKRNQELPCPHCNRVFKQKQRLDQHVQSQHADEAAPSNASAKPAEAGPSGSGASAAPKPQLFDVGSRGGFFTQKTPRMMLHEVMCASVEAMPRHAAQRACRGPPARRCSQGNLVRTSDQRQHPYPVLWDCAVMPCLPIL